MGLTKNMEHFSESTVLAGDSLNAPHINLSNYYTEVDSLANKRILSSRILSIDNIKETLVSVIEVIIQHIHQNGKILIGGNGGSASQSQHFCSELMGRFKKKRSPIRAISLCSDISLATCISNDFGYERLFSRQVEALGESNDMFVAFTTSGNSRNIIEALCECKSRGICSVVFSGEKTESMNHLADYIISIPSEDTAIIQEIHMQMIHIICEIIEDNLNEDISVWHDVLELSKQGYASLILDRDGVINHVKANGYIKFNSEFSFREDFLINVRQLSDTFRYIFIVSNQKGVGKGLMSMSELDVIHAAMLNEITQKGGRIDKIYVSTSVDNNAFENKPNTGMANQIKNDYPDIDFRKTIVVGDSASDRLFAEKLESKFIYDRTR